VNDAHEKRVKELIKEEWPEVPISLSSEVQPIIREYYRTSCVSFDAMLKPVFSNYVTNLRRTLEEYGYNQEVAMVVSTGGVMSANEVMERPVFSLFSGPAMGPGAGLFFASQEGLNNCVVIDMGGTSFDVSTVIDGQPTLTRSAKVEEYPTGVTSIELLTLGAGGGSIAWVDTGGLLHVGPESAGADPGPACYMKGGENPTVTDANVILGYLDPDYFLGGKMKIDPALSQKAIKEKIATPLNLTVEEAAQGIYRVVNADMVGGILDMTVRRGVSPKDFILVVGGGAAGMHALKLASELGMGKVIIPRAAAVLCALGMLNADVNFSHVGSKYAESYRFDYDGVNTLLSDLERKGKEALEREGIPSENQRFEYYAAIRYPMQVTELDINLPNSRIIPDMMDQMIQDFHQTHERRYAVNDPTSSIEFTDWRVVARGLLPKLQLREQPHSGEDSAKALKSKRKAYFEALGGFTDTAVYDGNKLSYGMLINGPAIIEEPLTTVVLIPGSTATVNKVGSYVIELS
jgi:N-methylhydantoinase A